MSELIISLDKRLVAERDEARRWARLMMGAMIHNRNKANRYRAERDEARRELAELKRQEEWAVDNEAIQERLRAIDGLG